MFERKKINFVFYLILFRDKDGLIQSDLLQPLRMSQPLVDDVFNQFTSTVFQCDTTKDARYIRCDFKRCSKHSTITSTDKVPTDFWIRNTEKNVKILEQHVSNEVFTFIETLEADEEELNLSVDYD